MMMRQERTTTGLPHAAGPSRQPPWAARLAALLGVVLAPAVGAQSGDWIAAHQRISDTSGKFTGILDDGDVFGIDSITLGDLDGDGVPDVLVGSKFDDDGGTDQGALYTLFLLASGKVKSHRKISATTGGFTGALSPSDLFGNSVANLGDLDGDGVVDIAVASLLDDDGGTDRGAVWILFLQDDGSVKDQRKISSTTGGFTGTLSNNDWFGASLDSAGDLDGDGVTDLVVGAVKDDDGGADRGAIWVLYLQSDGSVKSHTKISHGAGGGLLTLANGDEFGDGVALLADLDGNGTRDLAVGAHADDDSGDHSGSVWILFLESDQSVSSVQKISGTSGGFGGTLDPFDIFGLGLTRLGDLDGDGIEELAVGAVLDDDGGFDKGAFWILFLRADGTVRDQQKISSLSGGFSGTLRASDHFGRPRCAGDVDGDGIGDLIVGSTGSDDGGPDRGATWILFLNRCVAATAVVQNGTGINPLTLTSRGSPQPGQAWSLDLDASGHAPGIALVEARATGTVGPVTQAGEFLIDLASPFYFNLVLPHSGGSVNFAIQVPADAALCGLTGQVQGAVFGAPGPVLSNALALVIGSP